MYSGLLPKGLSEAELISDDSDNDVDSGEIDHSEATATKYDGQSAICSDIEPLPVNSSQPGKTSSECLPGISEDMWEKFKQLQKQKGEIGMLPPIRRKRKRRGKRKHSDFATREDETKEVDGMKSVEKHVEGLKQYFGIKERSEAPPCSKRPSKSGLEKTLETAIAAGDYEKAEELSDRLATRELAVKIKNAVDCRDFMQARQETAAASKAAKDRKKKLAWGFEAKKRWETKSNMGYM